MQVLLQILLHVIYGKYFLKDRHQIRKIVYIDT